MSEIDYRFTVRLLSEDEGGGWLIEFPDLPGCMSDGETIAEAIANGEDAKRCWIAAMRGACRPVPPPSIEAEESYSGKWQLRAPKSLHRRLAERAARGGEPTHSPSLFSPRGLATAPCAATEDLRFRMPDVGCAAPLPRPVPPGEGRGEGLVEVI